MLILGIETSCDETSVALVRDGMDVLGIRTFSQVRAHKPFGGVVPEIASRIHVRVIHALVEDLLRETGISRRDLDAVAVTSCPGLIGSLVVGVSFANAFAFALGIPVLGIHHLEAHIYAAFMNPEARPELPAVALVVSGGHTALVRMSAIGRYEILGQTLDDAAGEAFDKTAKMLSLPYPGGPMIDRLSARGNPEAYPFPRSLRGQRDRLDFSFSGLKTAVLYTVTGQGGRDRTPLEPTETNVADVAASFQRAVVESLVDKTARALERFEAKSLILCGGVAANQELQQAIRALAARNGVPAFIPPISYCTDNAAMIAGLAFHKQHEMNDLVSDVAASRPLGDRIKK